MPLVAGGVLTIKDPKDPSDPIGSTTKQDQWDAYHNILVANAKNSSIRDMKLVKITKLAV